MTYREAKLMRLPCVYGPDEYGGVARYELDWKQDIVWERGRFCDHWETIADFFLDTENKMSETLPKAASMVWKTSKKSGK